MKSAYDIFISYRRKDAQGSDKGVHIARTIKQYLEIKGYKGRVFFDYSELSNEDFDKRILSVIRQAKVFISVLTPDSMLRCVNDGDWVRRELLEAYNNKLQMIFINPDGREIQFLGGFPEELSFVKTRNHLTVHMDSSFERDMDDLIEKHIAPVSAPSDGSNSGKYAKVRVRTDHDCIIKRFDEEIGSAKVGEYSIVYLPKGKHRITFMANDAEAAALGVSITQMFEIKDIDYEDYIEVSLKDVYDKRLKDLAISKDVESAAKKREGFQELIDEGQVAMLRDNQLREKRIKKWTIYAVIAILAVVVGVFIWGGDDMSGPKPNLDEPVIIVKDTVNLEATAAEKVANVKIKEDSNVKDKSTKGETSAKVQEQVVEKKSETAQAEELKSILVGSKTKSGTINGHEYVDLGLPSGLKWATCNVGASSQEEYGDYYAWGEVETKNEYTADNSKTYGKLMSDISGNSTYDVARAKWGGSWRLPTKKELEELESKCKREWTTLNGKKGYIVTGPNGNSIFLPAAGHRYRSSLYYAGENGYYWSSTPSKSNDKYAYYLYLSSSNYFVYWNNREYGQSVRPVSE